MPKNRIGVGGLCLSRAGRRRRGGPGSGNLGLSVILPEKTVY
jgi:hypothetical protein